jgi:hypothetical protein
MCITSRKNIKREKEDSIVKGQTSKRTKPTLGVTAGQHNWMDLCLCIMLELGARKCGRSIQRNFQMDGMVITGVTALKQVK